MFSAISESRSWGLLEGNCAVLFDVLAQPSFADGFGNHVDGTADNRFQSPPQGIHAAEIGQTARTGFGREPQGYVEIGCRAIVATRDRPEQRQGRYPGSAQFQFVIPQAGYDQIPFHHLILYYLFARCHR
jgi:hypothetical protein